MSVKVLLEPFKIGDLVLKNKILMAPMTRSRADPKSGIPSDLHVKYYSQRAGAGLVVTECSYIDQRGHGQIGECGIENKDHVEGWKKVTKAVHDKGGKIFIQIYHCGRVGHDAIIGRKPEAPSSIKIPDTQQCFTGSKFENYPEPKEMTEEDIKYVIKKFDDAGKLAQQAGFDGIELHAATGYLMDSFLKDWANRRKDAWGGSIENRSKFVLEIADNAIKTWGSKRVGIKLSPVGRFNDQYDSNPVELYNYLIRKLVERKLGYISLFEFDGFPKQVKGLGSDQIPSVRKAFKHLFKDVPLVTTGGLEVEEAVRRVTEKEADLVSMAKPWISNPDLVERLTNGWPLAKADPSKFYVPGAQGYIDYPFYHANE